MTTGGVMFSNVALKEYGIQKFNSGHPALDILSRSIKRDVGKIEGDSIIDTDTEAAIALWIASPVKIQTLPQNELGAKRLCFDLLTKMAENPAAAVKYQQAITMVLKEAKEKYGVNVSHDDVTTFYATTMQKKIYAMPLGEPLTPTEQNKAKELLLAYMVKPTNANAQAFRDFKDKISYSNSDKAKVLVNFMVSVSSRLSRILA